MLRRLRGSKWRLRTGVQPRMRERKVHETERMRVRRRILASVHATRVRAPVRDQLHEWLLLETESMLVQRGLPIGRGRITLSAGLRARLRQEQRALHGAKPLYLQFGLPAERHRYRRSGVHADLRNTVRERRMHRAGRLRVQPRLLDRRGYRSVRLQAQVRPNLPEREMHGAQRLHLRPGLQIERERGMRAELWRTVRDGRLYRA